jgi:hypothetical protein
MRKPAKRVMHRGRHKRDGIGREGRVWEVFHAPEFGKFQERSLRNLSISSNNRGGRGTGSLSCRDQIRSPNSSRIAAR